MYHVGEMTLRKEVEEEEEEEEEGRDRTDLDRSLLRCDEGDVGPADLWADGGQPW